MQVLKSKLRRLSITFLVTTLLLLPQCGTAFKFVYVPCDMGLAMEEWELHPKNQDDALGCLTDHLQKWYGRAGAMNYRQMEEFKGHIKMQMKVISTENP
jgi:hypothetical protein